MAVIKKYDVSDIKKDVYESIIGISGKDIHVVIETAHSGNVNGNRIILDQAYVDDMLIDIGKAITRHSTKYNLPPDEIIFRDKNQDIESQDCSPDEVIDVITARYELNDVALSRNTEERIKLAMSAIKNKKKLEDEWQLSSNYFDNRAIILNFYGKPGTGKSITAEAIAKELGKQVYRVNYSQLESKYVGETPKNIKHAFKVARENDAVLIFDEADSFLGKRLTSVTQSADYGVNITRSVLLMELEQFSGVVIFTTNLIENYDEAFKRRILLSVHFELPDEETREKIWKLHLGSKMPLAEKVTSEELAKRYEGISGADIKDIVFFAALIAVGNGDCIDFDTFDRAKTMVESRYLNEDKMNGEGFLIEEVTEVEEDGYVE